MKKRDARIDGGGLALASGAAGPAVSRRSYGRVTLKDIALDLDISLATVARAFQQNAIISNETRQLVLRRAEELGYRANVLARSLATRRTRIIGVIMSSVNSPIYSEVLAKFSERIHRIDMSLMLIPGSYAQDFDASLKKLLAYSPDAILVFSGLLSDAAIDQAKKSGVPLIYFNRVSRDPDAYGIGCDNEAAGGLVADYLIERGHRRLAFLSSGNDATTNVERHSGFAARAKERGLGEPKVIDAAGFSYEDGFGALIASEAVLSEIDCLFCASDLLALGFIDGARSRLGVRIPGQLAVVGCQNIALAAWPSHDLTTVCLPIDDMVEETIALLRRLGTCEDRGPEVLRLAPAGIVERATTAQP